MSLSGAFSGHTASMGSQAATSGPADDAPQSLHTPPPFSVLSGLSDSGTTAQQPIPHLHAQGPDLERQSAGIEARPVLHETTGPVVNCAASEPSSTAQATTAGSTGASSTAGRARPPRRKRATAENEDELDPTPQPPKRRARVDTSRPIVTAKHAGIGPVAEVSSNSEPVQVGEEQRHTNSGKHAVSGYPLCAVSCPSTDPVLSRWDSADARSGARHRA